MISSARLTQVFNSALKKKSCASVALVTSLLLLFSSVTPISAVDYLRPGDFDEESWSKTIDYLEYVDVYATIHGKPRPPPGAHAYLYMTYVNYLGVQMLYAGLSNITMGLGALAVTLPIQTFMLHYKTQDEVRDVVTASSYVMLMAFNETEETTIYSGSPDRNDTLYASFSMGFDLSSLIGTDAPALNSKTTIIPLTREDDSWSWGMTYTNLTALWWNMQISPDNSSYQSVPVAISVYEELTFTYDLTFDPDNRTAQILSNYTIGRMTDLWVVDKLVWFIPVVVHYNNTGCYLLDKSLYSNETIHQFLNKHNIGMSMVFFQASAILDHMTESKVNGENVLDDELIVSDDTITTFSDDGERVSSVDFGAKNNYTLCNHNSGESTTYEVVTRTAKRKGFAKNPIFVIHTFLMRYIPLALAHMDEPLYEQAKNQLLNMTYADYFYIVSYPTYDGYTIEHDPIHTVYFAPTAAGSNFGGLLVIVVIAGILVVSSAIILRRKAPKKSSNPQLQPNPQRL